MINAPAARAKITPRLAYVTTALVAFVVFLPWVQGFLVGDDWMLLARNVGRPLPALLQQISDASNSRWYRPLSEWSLALSWSLFGLNPAGHHILNSALHAFNAVLVAVIGQRLTRNVRMGLLAGLSFGMLACHTEAVIWITARHEMLAAAFALLGMISYIKYRDGGQNMWWFGTLLAYTLSLGFKETTLALPLLLALYDVLFVFSLQKGTWPWGLRAAQWAPSLLPATIGLAYLLFRLQVGGGYNVPYNLPLVSKNLFYYLMMETVALPASTYFLIRFPVVMLPVVAALTVACAVCVWLARDRMARNQTVWFGALWMVIALAPVILIVAERTTYFSSVGWAWTIAAIVTLAWDATPGHLGPRRWLVAFAVVAILGANLVTLTHRSYWWNYTSDISRNVFSQLRAALASLPHARGSQLWLINPPRRIEYAEALGNRLLFAIWLLQDQLGTDAQVVLLQDKEVNISPQEDMRRLLSEQAAQGPVVIFYWQGETLVKLSTAQNNLEP